MAREGVEGVQRIYALARIWIWSQNVKRLRLGSDPGVRARGDAVSDGS